MRALAAALRGDSPAEAQAQGDEAAKLIDELSDEELARGLDALVHLATAEMYLDRFVHRAVTPSARSRSDAQPARESSFR